jgi:hypothetical protein
MSGVTGTSASSQKYVLPGPELLGFRGGFEIEKVEEKEKIKRFGTICVKGGEILFVTVINPVTQVRTRPGAVTSLCLSPLWISVRAIVSVAASLANICTFGLFSKRQNFVERTVLGTVKAMACSTLSLITTPLNVAVEGIATISHVFKPELNWFDLLAAHMWTGFVGASLSKIRITPGVVPKVSETGQKLSTRIS